MKYLIFFSLAFILACNSQSTSNSKYNPVGLWEIEMDIPEMDSSKQDDALNIGIGLLSMISIDGTIDFKKDGLAYSAIKMGVLSNRDTSKWELKNDTIICTSDKDEVKKYAFIDENRMVIVDEDTTESPFDINVYLVRKTD